MKIVRMDSFDRGGEKPGRDDVLIESGLSAEDARRKADEMNAKFGGNGAPHFYEVVPDDYALRVYEP